jgi:hypothetical protein
VLKSFKDTQKRAEAADVLQALLQAQASFGALGDDPVSVAQRLVLAAWEADPEALDGRLYGQRPDKTTLAAIALASAMDVLPRGSHTHAFVLHCLRQLVADLAEPGGRLPLNPVDHELLAKVRDVLGRHSQKAALPGSW